MKTRIKWNPFFHTGWAPTMAVLNWDDLANTLLKERWYTETTSACAEVQRAGVSHTWVPSWSHLNSSFRLWPYKFENLMLMCSEALPLGSPFSLTKFAELCKSTMETAFQWTFKLLGPDSPFDNVRNGHC